ncbi:uncharacterized protein QC763_703040 [Podospora pseudopauciseta]|uniref:Thiamine-triphosphatase n=2 Tax=Podospora TaxID=5144 RepID=A0ABR0H076_9PEZI|nr:hypothetical protein QC763_703040 [Podospora pseudopauciseta]KAK4667974.1 hypothetical protein QC764_703040 [Podospora pseudoanserina]
MAIRPPLQKVLSPCILEVERKFHSLAARHLTQNGGIPPFQSLRSLPLQTIRDTYYDKSNLLSSSGAWIRRRNGIWEAKIRKGGDFTNSRFEELNRVSDIAACVENITGIQAHEKEDFGLGIMADFVTTRETWIADEEFRIVRDNMDFGHEVGEVELQRVLDGEASEEEKMGEMERMDERIGEFMRRYGWAFRKGRPVGKLTAYFEMMGQKRS